MTRLFLEDYIKLDQLGQGGYAIVYKVRHKDLGYIRAIKVLNNTIADGESDRIYQKFLKECRLLLRLGNGNHPNIVHIYRPLLRAQKAMVEMDFVDGKDLLHYLQDKSFFVEIEEVMKLLTDIGSALAYCHEDIYKFCMNKEEYNLKDDLDDQTRCKLINKYRVIHNDIHSGNIIRRENGNFVLLDFGLAVDGEEIVRSSRKKNGAPEFKSPEKWENEGILTTRSDIYSFGVVLYEFLTGRVPFIFDKNNPNPTEAEYLLCKAHKETMPEPIYELRKAKFEQSHPGEKYEKDYPDWLEELIMKCLEKNPEDRFQNGKDLYDNIKESYPDWLNELIIKYLEKKSENQFENMKVLHNHIKNLIYHADLEKKILELGIIERDNMLRIFDLKRQEYNVKRQLQRALIDLPFTIIVLSVSIIGYYVLCRELCIIISFLNPGICDKIVNTWINITSSLHEFFQHIINYLCN